MKSKMKVVTTCDIDPALWLDYVDGELDPSLKSDLKLHLQNCSHCQQSFSEFKALKNTVQKSDEALEIPSDDYFKILEGKIMSSLDKPMAKVSQKTRRERYFSIPFALPAVTAAAALFLLILGGLYKTMNFKAPNSTEVVQAKLEEQFIVQAANNDPEAISNALISHQDVEDVVMNATAEKLSRMSDREAARVLDAMK